MMTQHKYAKTTAAMMLAAGLRLASDERGLSLREIGRRLGYRQPVVLSHMASGRVPVPVDRAQEIAEQVGIPRAQFLEAVLHQHHPEVEWGLVTGKSDPFILELEGAAGKPLSDLSAAHRQVLREVVKDNKPEERWLSIPEISALKLLRKIFPNMQNTGLSEDDRDALRLAASLSSADDAGKSSPTTSRSKKNES